MHDNPSAPVESPGNQPVNQTVDEAHLSGRQTGLGCFKCEGELEIADIAGIKIAACGDCHGLLVQNMHLASLINVLRAGYEGSDALATPMAESHLQQKTRCRACGDSMETHAYMGPGNVAIDSCHNCKMVWLDASELTRIVRAPGRRNFRPEELIGFEPGVIAAQAPLHNQNVDAVDSTAIALAWLFC